MGKTSIEWATHTRSWLAGCTKVSPACTHCYAETMTARLSRMPKSPAQYRDGVVNDQRWTGRIAYNPDALRAAFESLRNARHPQRVFINSMSDTFHADVPPESLEHLQDEISMHDARCAVGPGLRAPHVIMLLTKRPDRMLAWQREHFPAGLPSWVWVGCTVEDQRRAHERVPVLLQVQATVRFLSMEPLLELVDLAYAAFNGADSFGSLEGIHWVIAGGESGPRARPSHPDWFRSLRDQCERAGVAYHFKQWGSHRPKLAAIAGEPAPVCGTTGWGTLDRAGNWSPTATPWNGRQDGDSRDDAEVVMVDVGKHVAGRVLDGRTHDGLPGAP